MMGVKSIRIINSNLEKDWDALASHPLQSWAWGEFRKRMGLDLVRLGVYEDELLTDVFQLTFHPIPHTPLTIGYLPKGPMLSVDTVGALRNVGRKKRSVFIQIEPNIISNVTVGHKPLLTFGPLRPSHHPLFTKYTFRLDLTKTNDELLKSMHPKTRYNIKVATKHGVIITEDNSDQAFQTYLALTHQTTERQAFYAHTETYHRVMWEILHKAGIANLFTATYQGKTLAAWILFHWKDTIYYPYGSSSRENREVMAPTLLLYQTALWGKSKGFKVYDLWGALGPSDSGIIDEKNPWYGFHRFKQGFGPDLVEFIGSYDLVIKPILYELYKLADVARWSYLKLKSKK